MLIGLTQQEPIFFTGFMLKKIVNKYLKTIFNFRFSEKCVRS